jgi:hypothetical protein
MYSPWLEYLVNQNAGAVQKRSGVPASYIAKIRDGIEEGKKYRIKPATRKALRNCYRRTMYAFVRQSGMSRQNAKTWAGFVPTKVFHQVKVQNEFIQVRAHRQKKLPQEIIDQMIQWKINPVDIEKWNDSPKLKRLARKLRVAAPEPLAPEIRGDRLTNKTKNRRKK